MIPLSPRPLAAAVPVALAVLSVTACGPAIGPEEIDALASELGGSADGGALTTTGPLSCADPTVFQERFEHYIFCTGMHRAWKTADWKSYQDVGRELTFDLSSAPAASQNKSQWWAPAVFYVATDHQYVMWVSVIDGGAWRSPSRSLAVLTSPAPLGPWKFRGYGLKVTADGEMEIDPMVASGHDGALFLFWKRYGGGNSSSIVGARLDGHALKLEASTETVLLNGYDNTSWELNVRENPAVWQDPATRDWHMLYSGAHWFNDTYATGHAVSRCGALCKGPSGWQVTSAGDDGVAEVTQAKGDPRFAHGGPGGAVWIGNAGQYILVSAAANSRAGDATRYIAPQRVKWKNGAPYVDTPKHVPGGYSF